MTSIALMGKGEKMAEWIVELGDGNIHIKKMSPIVRCKDCKFNLDDHCDNWSGWELVASDDYCSRSVRHDD